jgi:hypothetical protein
MTSAAETVRELEEHDAKFGLGPAGVARLEDARRALESQLRHSAVPVFRALLPLGEIGECAAAGTLEASASLPATLVLQERRTRADARQLLTEKLASLSSQL